MKKLYGTGVALVTPMGADGKIDFKGLERMIRHASKADYMVVMGTTGESATLNEEERASVLATVLRVNKRSKPVVYGIGGNNTAGVIAALRAFDPTGVSAILSVSPYYNKPSQEGLYRHFMAIADQSPLPVILYNVPGRTGSNLTADTTIRLSAHTNIIGIKEASGNLEQCMRIVREARKGFMLISGDDMLTVPMISIGGVGVISVLANAFPGLFRKMTDSMALGKISAAGKIQRELLAMNSLMYEEGNPVGLKALLAHLGLCEGHVRLPLVSASDDLTGRISRCASALNK
ncbi:MAG: 4-hydroxy-tetrahydrodipicolinate synthase [Bacteroidota bacterium]